MKKHYLDTTFDEEFLMFGVVSNERPHRIAWILNDNLGFNFERKDDIHFLNKDQQESFFPRFEFIDDLNRLQYHLLGNNDEGQRLLPELKNVDYLLIIKGAIDYLDPKLFLGKVKLLESIQLITELDPNVLKSKQNLIIPD